MRKVVRKTLAEYAKNDGYEDEQGFWYEDAGNLLQTGVLGFCGSGRLDDSLLYVLRGLELIDEKGPDASSEWDAWYAGHRARLDEHFKTSGAEYFFMYWCDKEGLTEHGGSVPGWLDDKGHNLLALLREWRDSRPPEEVES